MKPQGLVTARGSKGVPLIEVVIPGATNFTNYHLNGLETQNVFLLSLGRLKN
jgi:hypothetical protein